MMTFIAILRELTRICQYSLAYKITISFGLMLFMHFIHIAYSGQAETSFAEYPPAFLFLQQPVPVSTVCRGCSYEPFFHNLQSFSLKNKKRQKRCCTFRNICVIINEDEFANKKVKENLLIKK